MDKVSSKNGEFLKIVGITEIIIALLMILCFIFIVISNKSKSKEGVELSDFEKVGIYNYLENYFIDYNIIDNVLDNGDEKLNNLQKDIIVLEDYFKKNNTTKMSEEEFRKSYSIMYGESNDIDISIPELANANYEYDMGNNIFSKIDNSQYETKENRTYKINTIKKQYDNYIVEFDVFEKNAIEEKENIGKAYLTLRVEEGRYIIVNFSKTI